MSILSKITPEKIRKFLTAAFIVGLLAWVMIGVWVGPYIVRQAHAGTGFEYITEMMKHRHEHPASYYNWYWYRFMGIAGASFIGLYAFGMLLTSQKFFDRCVGKATPLQLGGIRMLVSAILLTSILWENVPSSALLPRSMLHGVGVLSLLMKIPGFEAMLASQSALQYLDYLTIATLVMAMVGLFTRVTVPLGAFLYLMMAGILRSYAWPYHTGVLPMYVLFVLSFTPCGDAWSVDRLRKIRTGKPVPDVNTATVRYGWARYATWSILAIAYAAAGLSKARNGGLGWLNPNNFKNILFGGTLQPMEFDFGLSLYFENFPDWFFVSLAIGAMLMQMSCILLLFSKLARRILPLAIIGMHTGIWLLQNILFFDVLILPLIFYDFSPLLQKAGSLFALQGAKVRIAAQDMKSSWWGWGPVRAWLIALLLLSTWTMKYEFYPLTSMQMFSRPTNETTVVYYKILSHHADGHTQRAPIEKSIGAMSDSRYRAVLKMAFKESRQKLCQEFFDAVARNYHPRKGESPITAFEVQKWRWDFTTPSRNRIYGSMDENRVYRVGARSIADNSAHGG